MAWKVDKRIPEGLFIQLLTEKANIIKDHLQNRCSKLTLVANVGPTMATFKLFDTSKEDYLQLHVTLSNLGDIDEQIHQLWQQVNFLLKQYCSHCQNQRTKNDNYITNYIINNCNNYFMVCITLITVKLKGLFEYGICIYFSYTSLYFIID